MGGKKLCQSSTKISKNDHKKQQLNSLIKVLRPKVYITDSSSFKTLVQELTGNGTTPLLFSNSPPPLPMMHQPNVGLDHRHSVIEINDDITGYNSYQDSPDFSSLASSDELSAPTNSFNTPSLEYNCSPEELGLQYATGTFNEFESSLAIIPNHEQPIDDHVSQYRDVESWLLEMDPFVSCNDYDHGYVPLNILPEACMYDYEFSGLIL